MKKKLVKKYKKKRGFTLIELLAVILILGIIALIAIPTVSSVVEESRKGAAEQSASQLVSSINSYVVQSDLVGNKLFDGTYDMSTFKDKLDIKGTMPDSGFITITNGEVSDYSLVYGSYSVVFDGEKSNTGKLDTIRLLADNNNNGIIDTSDEVLIGNEHFYVMSNDGTTTRMLSKYVLKVGYDISDKDTGSEWIDSMSLSVNNLITNSDNTYFFESYNYSPVVQDNNYNIQDPTYSGTFSKYIDTTLYFKVRNSVVFTNVPNNNSKYWFSGGTIASKYREYEEYGFPFVFDENTFFYPYVMKYEEILKKYDESIFVTIPYYNELINLGCNYSSQACSKEYVCSQFDVNRHLEYTNKNKVIETCSYAGQVIERGGTAPSWVYSYNYWTGAIQNNKCVVYVGTTGSLLCYSVTSTYYVMNLRPVVSISTDKINK